MTTYPMRTRRWTRKEYDRLIEVGVLHEDEPIELIGGQLIVAEPKGTPHATAVGLAADTLRAAFGRGWVVRVQDPLALDDESEPEPDVAVVRGEPRDYVATHPADPVLVVEVALTSLGFDRGPKSSLYARAGRPEYWIINLVDRVLEIRRDPAPSSTAPYGWDYSTVEVLRPGDRARPLATTAPIAVVDLLP